MPKPKSQNSLLFAFESNDGKIKRRSNIRTEKKKKNIYTFSMQTEFERALRSAFERNVNAFKKNKSKNQRMASF